LRLIVQIVLKMAITAMTPGPNAKSKWAQHQFTAVLIIVQIAVLVLLIVYAEHRRGALPGGVPELESRVQYTDFQDVHIAVIVGFGFLVAFLRRYSFASFAISLLLAAVAIEWAIVIRGMISDDYSSTGRFNISLSGLINADFTAAVVLITFGAIIGKVSPIQCLILTLIEVPVSIGNEWLVVRNLRVQDVGGAATVHVFGAIFGIVVSRVILNKAWKNSEDQGSVYHSEVITFIGAAFLWVLWPAFNAVNVVVDARYRAVINSYIALVGSTVAAFLVSQALSNTHRFVVRHIVSASLAGGVALGACANILLTPWSAYAVGTVAGVLAVVGLQKVNPAINRKMNVYDSRGVLSLHGISGIVGVLASAIFLVVAPTGSYPTNTRILGTDRTTGQQAGMQLLGLLITIAIAALSGAITGVIIKLKVWNQVSPNEYFSDGQFFVVPEDYEFTSRVTSKIDRVEINEPNAPASQQIITTDPEQIALTSTTVVEEHTTAPAVSDVPAV
jgi:ammonium transporter Rh